MLYIKRAPKIILILLQCYLLFFLNNVIAIPNISPKIPTYIKRTWPVVTFSNITLPPNQCCRVKNCCNCNFYTWLILSPVIYITQVFWPKIKGGTNTIIFKININNVLRSIMLGARSAVWRLGGWMPNYRPLQASQAWCTIDAQLYGYPYLLYG